MLWYPLGGPAQKSWLHFNLIFATSVAENFWLYSLLCARISDPFSDARMTQSKSYLLERFELDVAKVWFVRVGAVWPEIFVTEFCTFGCACVAGPASLEGRRAWRSMRLWTLRDFCLVNLQTTHHGNDNQVVFWCAQWRNATILGPPSFS